MPKHLEVWEDGDLLWITVHAPGFERNPLATVHCIYIDGAGRTIKFDGIRR